MSEGFCRRDVAFGDLAWATGAGADDQVPEGLHWHVTLGPRGGLPAGPTILLEVPVNEDSFRAVGPLQTSPIGTGPWEIDEDDGRRLTLAYPPAVEPLEVLGWAWLQADGDLRLTATDRLRTPAGTGSVIAERSEPLPGDHQHAVAAAGCETVEVTGRGAVHEAYAEVGTWHLDRVDPSWVVDRAGLATELAQTLPLYLPAPWAEDWRTRVELSAPLHRLPHDAVDPGLLQPDGRREVDRVRQLVEPRRSAGGGEEVDGVGAWAEAAYGSVVAGGVGRLVGQSVAAEGVAASQVSQDAVQAYLQAAVDPGVARWMGLSGTLEREPEHLHHGRGLLVALLPTLIRRQPWERGRGRGLSRLDRLEQLYDEELGGGYADLQGQVAQLAPLLSGDWWDLRLLAVPIPYLREAPSDRPRAPGLTVRRPAWAPVAVDRWSASVAVEEVVPRGLVSFVQTAPTPRTLHPGPPGAPAPMLAGWSKVDLRHVLHVDELAGTDPAVELTVRLGDWLGRWGGAGSLTVPRPDRPLPPQPRLTTGLVLAEPAPTGDGAASCGAVRVEVLAAGARAPGSMPVTALVLDLPRGGPQVLDLTAAEGRSAAPVRRVVHHPAPMTVPGQVVDESVSVRARDADGRESAATTVTVRVVDPRPIRAPRVGPRLIPTTRRSGAPTVSVTLAIEAAPHARAYRVLMAGESALRRAFGMPADTAGSRAERARAVRAQMGARDRRSHYSWASTASFPVKGSTCYATLELPAGIDGVVFVRAVAVTATPSRHPGGPPTETVTTPFSATDPVALVVPLSEFPPVPDLVLRAEPEGVVAATVRVTRPPSGLLGSLPRDGIEARLVEHLGSQVQPVYWPELATVRLAPRPEEPEVHEGTVRLRGVPWVRSALAACVRYPAEATLAPGATELPTEIRSTGPQLERIPSPWGPYSTPAWVDTTGPLPTLGSTATGGSIEVTVAGLTPIPEGRPRWTAQLLAGAGALVPRGTPVAAEQGVTIPVVEGERYAIQLRDPFGAEHEPWLVPAP
ncbi:hypothetical protein J4G33_09765 [Actinotalea sp. BY-33]|uniref:Uncharacterized protein n=1 Tax=Actinotalea soli TaxID=2819234 RepID=A0A939LTZ1_9CELL|nr:hypothetical protein [Actinotalea soli]MBO1752089.1 hypothetical protein [Actinotalea soli]